MTTYTSKNELYSHPSSKKHPSGKELTTHLKNVATNSTRLAPKTNLRGGDWTYQQISYDIGILHDIGKLTQHFQRYIRDEPYNNQLKTHSKIGAVIAAEALCEKYSPYIGLLGYLSINNHHGSLQKTISKELTTFRVDGVQQKKEREALKKQIKNIYQHTYPIANALLQEVTDSLTFKQVGDTILQDKTNLPTIEKHRNENIYFDTLILWSTLITSDKLDASNLDTVYFKTTQKLQRQTIDSHINDLQNEEVSQLNQIRESSRQNAINWAETVNVNPNTIYNLSLPTGFGKTLTGLSVGLTLANRKNGNVIYALPYTSIIDQVDETIQTVFDVSPNDPEYTIHHYLADKKTDISTEQNEDTDIFSTRDEIQLAKTWNSSLTLTTFVQLFESLVTPQNTQSMKLSALQNSVIILDEPQAISNDWSSIIPYLLQQLGKIYNITFISMTATQPSLFSSSPYTTIQDIPVGNKAKSYLKTNPRIKYTLDASVEEYLKDKAEAKPLTHSDLTTKITNKIQKHTSLLTICNTIESAETLTKNLQNTLPQAILLNDNLQKNNELNSTLGIAHLTTRLTPKDRQTLLQTIQRRLKQNKPTIVFSTQLIEAGVDISFNYVIRDLAPFSSVVQAAGRCNRNNERNIGTTELIRLNSPYEDIETTPSARVYNRGEPKLLNHTYDTLTQSKKHQYTETEFIDLTQSFFDKISLQSKEYITYLKDYQLQKIVPLSLINSRQTANILVLPPQKISKIQSKLQNTTNKSSLQYKIKTDNELNNIAYPIPDQEYDPEDERRTIENNCIYHKESQVYLLKNTSKFYTPLGLDFTKSSNHNFL